MDLLPIENIVKEFLDVYAAEIRNSGHSASGALANDKSFEVKYEDGQLIVTLILQDHWKFLENGTKPGEPDSRGLYSYDLNRSLPRSKSLREAIYEWIQTKNILPREPKMNLELLSYAIATSIRKNGILCRDGVKIKAPHILADTMVKFSLRLKIENEFLHIWITENLQETANNIDKNLK